MLNFRNAKSVHIEDRATVQKVDAGKLNPVMCVPFDFSEGGLVEQKIIMEAEPIPGRLITPYRMHVQSVLVPTQAAVEHFDDGNDVDAGSTEKIKRRLTDGEVIFPLISETAISKMMGVHPIMIAGVPKLSQRVHHSYGAAVNHLRKMLYVDAVLLRESDPASWRTNLSPALLSSTILQRFNAVLDPDRRINGAINLSGDLPITGIRRIGGDATDEGARYGADASTAKVTDLGGGRGVEFDISSTGVSEIRADLSGTSDISLRDFYDAKFMDRMASAMRDQLESDPVHGPEKIIRACHGFSYEAGRECMTIYDREFEVNKYVSSAMDKLGFDNNVRRTDTGIEVNLMLPVPRTELGCVVVTFVSIKPVETIGYQPHPKFTRPYVKRNFMAEEMSVDPVPILMRQIDSEVAQIDEDTIAFYMGENHLERYYESHGFTRNTDPEELTNKSAVWTLEIPKSVTPQTVLYPDNLENYPFGIQDGPVATITMFSKANVTSPVIMGPSPVETSDFIDDADLFEQEGQ